MEDKLKDLRDKIDTIDLQILDLIQSRAAHASKIGEIKKESSQFDGMFYKPEREIEIINKKFYTYYYLFLVGLMLNK